MSWPWSNKEPFTIKKQYQPTGAWRDYQNLDEHKAFADLKDELEDGNYKLVKYQGKGKGYKTFWTRRKGESDDVGQGLAGLAQLQRAVEKNKDIIEIAYRFLHPQSNMPPIDNWDDWVKAQAAGMIPKPNEKILGIDTGELFMDFLQGKLNIGKKNTKPKEKPPEDELIGFTPDQEKVVIAAMKKNPEMVEQFRGLLEAVEATE